MDAKILAQHETLCHLRKMGGTREVNASRAWSSTQSPNTKGECLGGGHNHHQTPATGTCGKYLKWPVLR